MMICMEGIGGEKWEEEEEEEEKGEGRGGAGGEKQE